MRLRRLLIGICAVGGLLAPLAFGTGHAASLRPGPTAATASHDLAWALALKPDEASELSYGELLEASAWLWYWPNMSNPPVTGDTQMYQQALRKSNALLRAAQKKRPDAARPYWMQARNLYDLGELLPKEAKEKRLRLYNEMIAKTQYCIDNMAPKNSSCWHFLATGKGRRSTTRGVINSMFEAKNVEAAWRKSVALEPHDRLFNGRSQLVSMQYGLGVFYRMVPDLWLVELVIGTRGDIEKSVSLFREAAAAEPNRLELQKELAASLLCWDHREDRPEARREAMDLLNRILDGDFDDSDIRATDPIDKTHAADLRAHPERACGYSRDGYQDVESEEAKRKLKSQR